MEVRGRVVGCSQEKNMSHDDDDSSTMMIMMMMMMKITMIIAVPISIVIVIIKQTLMMGALLHSDVVFYRTENKMHIACCDTP